MKSNKKKLFKAAGILAIGALLTAGGLFLWQNQFNIIFAPKASTNTVQAAIVIGEVGGNPQSYGKLVVEELNKQASKKIEFVSRAETGIATTSLRDQTVFGYNDVTKPITDHIYFLAITGRSSFVDALKKKEAPQLAASKVTKQITDMVELAASRPGVFPEGFTLFIAAFPDPLNGTGNTQSCGGQVTNQDAEYTKELYQAISTAIKNTKTVYPQQIQLVDTETTFKAHGVGAKESWFSSCLSLNDTGEMELSKLFLSVINSNDN